MDTTETTSPKSPITARKAALAYLQRFDGETYQQHGRFFRSIILCMPDFPNLLMQDINPEDFTQKVLAHASSASLRLRYAKQLRDFFRFAAGKGWTKGGK